LEDFLSVRKHPDNHAEKFSVIKVGKCCIAEIPISPTANSNDTTNALTDINTGTIKQRLLEKKKKEMMGPIIHFHSIKKIFSGNHLNCFLSKQIVTLRKCQISAIQRKIQHN